MLKPIVVDLDGTLVRTDLLYESANRYVRRGPLALFHLAKWTAEGKAPLKRRLAEAIDLDVAALPFREDVIEWLRGQRDAGRTLVLATASNETYARAVSEHLGIFDDVIGSDATRNLGSGEKARALVERYGEGGFDYIGDHRADLPVWEKAKIAHVVSGSGRLREQAGSRAEAGMVFDRPGRSGVAALVKALRPHQWAKNALVLVPLVLSHHLGNPTSVIQALLAFVVFCLAASGVYVLNDLTDLDADRRHHRKRARPFASGELSLLVGWWLWPLLIGSSLVFGFLLLPLNFGIALAVYIALTFAYSFVLKSRAIIDVITLALLYTSRLVAGALAIGVVTTFWLLAFSLFFFLSLALMKRYNDVLSARDAGNTGAISGRGYVHSDAEPVTTLGIAAGMVSVLILALYIKDPEVSTSYATPYALWVLVPLLLFWIARVWLLVHRGLMNEDPVLFAVRDRMSWLVIAVGIVAFAVASFVRL